MHVVEQCHCVRVGVCVFLSFFFLASFLSLCPCVLHCYIYLSYVDQMNLDMCVRSVMADGSAKLSMQGTVCDTKAFSMVAMPCSVI